MDDAGFDVENHTMIDPIFGTAADFDELISEMNKRGNVYNYIRTLCSPPYMIEHGFAGLV